jgi:hypothetical protein
MASGARGRARASSIAAVPPAVPSKAACTGKPVVDADCVCVNVALGVPESDAVSLGVDEDDAVSLGVGACVVDSLAVSDCDAVTLPVPVLDCVRVDERDGVREPVLEGVRVVVLVTERVREDDWVRDCVVEGVLVAVAEALWVWLAVRVSVTLGVAVTEQESL